MKSITKCFLFSMQNETLELAKKMNSYEPSSDNLSPSAIVDNLNTIQKRFNYPLKNKVIDDLKKERVIPIHNKVRVQIPSCIPAYLIVHPQTKKITSIANTTLYGVMLKDGTLQIDNRQLYAVLQTASLTLGCYENWNSLIMNQNICKQGSMMYAKMFTKVLDKMFALLDPIKSDKIKFITAKFFLLNVLGKADGSNVRNMAQSACTNNTSLSTLQSFEETFQPEDFTDLSTFLKALTVNVEGFGHLTIRTFLDSFIKMYGSSSILALEYFPAFCHMIFSALLGAHLNSEYVIVGLFGKEMDKFYNDVVLVVK